MFKHMPTYFVNKVLFISFLILYTGVSAVRPQANVLPGNWYCDARWKGAIYAATVKNIAVDSRPKANAQSARDKFSAFAAKNKTENVVKFVVEKDYKGELEIGSELEVFNVKTEEFPAIKFKVGEKYLLYLETFLFYEKNKTYSQIRYVRPDGQTKLYSEVLPTAEFLEQASKINFDREVLGFDGEAIQGGLLGGKATSLPKPRYPPEARKDNAHGIVYVTVLVETDGKVVKAKALCPIHQSLGAAAESAALAARFSPTLISGKPFRVRGVIVYNFVP